MIVDAHLHVFAARSERYPRDVHELYPAELEAPVEALLVEMERAGVDRAVLVPLSAHDEYVRECLERYPGRFAAIGIQDPTSYEVDEYRRRVEASGLQGLRLFTLGDPAVGDVEELPSFPLLADLAQRGHKLWYYSAPEQLPLLERVLERLPELVVVLNHLGFCPGAFEVDEWNRPRIATELPPPTLARVLALARFPGVHVMFSGEYAFSQDGYPYADLAETVRALYETYGAERLLRASDWPWIAQEPGYAETLALADRFLPGLSEDERGAIRGGNAERLFTF